MTREQEDVPNTADEYVLGLMDDADAAKLEAAMEDDAALRDAIAASRERFLPLDTSIEPSIVNDSLWQRIEAKLPAQQWSTTPPSRLSGRNPIANDNRAGPWRLTAISAIAASLLLAIGLTFSLLRTVDPLVVAVLVNDTGDVQAVIEDFGNENATVRLLADFDVPKDKTIQVWTLPSQEMGPISLGLLEGVRSAKLAGPALPTPRGNQLYEITLEQAGGSPTGRPTGAILAKGFARFPR
ncbi:anti-sigma factor [Agrobacterium rubi]|uniref:Anti-sigma factor n=1 Tax=Agrobacterium rubi TaxID=28099 RepID=A0AAE7R6E6_9HYPH|nr:anti-sigma factor [Agrobacterium rubi]NTE88769.1 anti-sigma factor [Agrobacterium rubi]NTF04597.1 anti-sigma factor [Agrobacterium rubi]NTF39159.1 anti-sigma factor [Agrobacterium rubi]OCJ51328.1 anti-sigma factor [Agrobacterium rubi]QTG02808.1 anti-sigma factor [Agrobacterium rubi]